MVARVKAAKIAAVKPKLLPVFEGRKRPKLPEPVAKALAFLQEAENKSFYYQFEYGMLTEEGKNVHATNHVCHAEMSGIGRGYPNYEPKGKPAAIWSKYPQPGHHHKLSDEEVLAFNDWLVHRSPWKGAVVPGLSTEFVTKKGVVCPVNVPANYMVNFLMATRVACEHAKHVMMWNKLVKLGVHEDMAFIFGCILGNVAPIGDQYGISGGAGWGHHPFDSLTEDRVQNFILHIVAKPSKNYEDDQNYRPCTAVWGAGNKGYNPYLIETYPAKGAVKSNRMFKPIVPAHYNQPLVSHTLEGWAEIANIEHKRIKGNEQVAKEKQAGRARRRAKKAA